MTEQTLLDRLSNGEKLFFCYQRSSFFLGRQKVDARLIFHLKDTRRIRSAGYHAAEQRFYYERTHD